MDFDKWWAEQEYSNGFVEAEAAWDHQEEIIDQLKAIIQTLMPPE